MPDGGAPHHNPGADRTSADCPPGQLPGDTPLYENPALFDLVHRGYRGDVDWYRRTIGSDPVLAIDLGCGTGRLSIPLANDGHRVIAIDASEAMLERLRPRIHAHQTVGVLAADVRSLVLNVQADVILAACNFLGHFTASERRDLLRRCATWLRPGGRLLLDIANAGWHRANPHLARSVPHHDADLGESFAVTASSTVNDDQVSVAFAIHLADASGTPETLLADGSVSMRLIEAGDLIDELGSAGFTIDQCLTAFPPEETEAGGQRVVIAATRTEELP